MKVVSTEALTKLIQLVKSAFIKVEDVAEVSEIETEIPSEITLATVATSGDYNDLTNKPDLSAKANVDLSNITNTGKNIANWSTNVTNCITEIPQDIKLELNNGTLTLKAGSKVYIPNGSGVFDTVTITSDKTTTVSANGKKFIFLNPNENLQSWDIFNCFSGSTAPTSVHYPMWYDTTNNIIKLSNDYGSTWSGKFSFPICVVTISNGVLTSIDQVFNGFGYIGSTVFVLPGVKGLIPNGRNEDGTLKNTECVTGSVIVRTWSGNPVNHELAFTTTGIGINTHTYNIEENYLYNAANQKLTDRVVYGKMEFNSSSPWNVTSFSVKTPFHAVDYNDRSTISGWSMPSSRYINLTLGVSGSDYIAPANGYFYLAKQGNSGEWINLENIYGGNIGTRVHISNQSADIKAYIPVKRGDVVYISYSASGTTSRFRFIYTEGEENV